MVVKIARLYKIGLEKLSRVTQSTHLIPEIDGLRFLAIMPVIFLHLGTNYLRTSPIFSESSLENNFFFQIINTGGMGVNIFFSISGFVLALPFASYYLNGTKKVNLKQYYLRRLTRLEPPFFISMIVFFLAWLIIGKYSITQLLNSLWASLLYVHYFVFGKWSLINPISWSLETEVQFYILAPLLFSCFLVRKVFARSVLIIAICLVLAYIIFYVKDTLIAYHLTKSLITYFPFFATGILICGVYMGGKIEFKMKSYGLDIAGMTGIFFLYVFHYWYSWYALPVQCFGIVMIFAAAFKGKMFNRFFTSPGVIVIGGMCYSLYLLHYGLLYVLMFFTSDLAVNSNFVLSYLLQAVIIVPIVIVVSAVFFVLFEKPFMYRDWYQQFPKKYFNYVLNNTKPTKPETDEPVTGNR